MYSLVAKYYAWDPVLRLNCVPIRTSPIAQFSPLPNCDFYPCVRFFRIFPGYSGAIWGHPLGALLILTP